MFRIKICGVTNVPDAIAAVDAGADAIGLNFFEGSSRHITPAAAREISQALEFRAFPIGVFVNASQEAVESAVIEGFLHGIQLHGDESPGFLAGLTSWKLARASELAEKFEEKGGAKWAAPLREASAQHCLPFLIRVRRLSDEGVSAIHSDLMACHQAGGPPVAVLVDALTPGRYGGTGETVSWVGLADHRRWLGDTPLILAGGLTPDNVAEAIRIVRPHGVDVASGVESAPGKKDPHKVRDFIAAARAAFDAL